MKLTRGKPRVDELSYLAASALFLFFLIYSAPHFVHHAFDEAEATPCLALSIAKSCHLQPTSTANFSTIRITSECVVLSVEVWIPYLTPSPFLKRAPPVA